MDDLLEEKLKGNTEVEALYMKNVDDYGDGKVVTSVYMQLHSPGKMAWYWWNKFKKQWERNEVACGAFLGFEPGVDITEDEAMEIVNSSKK